MNTNNNSSNFWLQVKKEYIDENLEALINYLSKCTTKDRENHDYKLTIDALSDRVEDISNAMPRVQLFRLHLFASVLKLTRQRTATRTALPPALASTER